MIQVFVQVEKGIEENWRHSAPFQVCEGNFVRILRTNHVKHLKKFVTKSGVMNGKIDLLDTEHH